MLKRLFFVLVLNVIALGIALPVLPGLAKAVGGNAVDVGLLYAIQSLGQFIASPIWGGLSDKYGRKTIMIVAMVLIAVAEIGTAFSTDLTTLYASRFAVGLFAGVVSVASAYVADVTDSSNRSKGMAVIGISFGLGFTIGPAIGAIISSFTENTAGIYGKGMPFLFAAAFAFAGAMVCALFLIDSPRKEGSRRGDIRDLVALLGNVRLRPLFAVFFFYTVAAAVMEATFFLFMEARYEFTEIEVGYVFAGFGIEMAIVQGGVGRLAKKLGDQKMAVVGGVLTGLGLIVAPLLMPLSLFIIAIGVSTAGRALIHPGILSLTSRSSPDEASVGRVMGALQSSGSCARIIGPAVGGWMFAHVAIEAPFILAGVVMLAVIVAWAVLVSYPAPADEGTS